jgi:hypothetical protein
MDNAIRQAGQRHDYVLVYKQLSSCILKHIVNWHNIRPHENTQTIYLTGQNAKHPERNRKSAPCFGHYKTLKDRAKHQNRFGKKSPCGQRRQKLI